MASVGLLEQVDLATSVGRITAVREWVHEATLPRRAGRAKVRLSVASYHSEAYKLHADTHTHHRQTHIDERRVLSLHEQ